SSPSASSKVPGISFHTKSRRPSPRRCWTCSPRRGSGRRRRRDHGLRGDTNLACTACSAVAVPRPRGFNPLAVSPTKSFTLRSHSAQDLRQFVGVALGSDHRPLGSGKESTMRGFGWVRVFIGLTLLALSPAIASAQSTIAGVVKDTSGAVLPGVTVEAASPVLIEKSRSVVTDGDGRYS